MTELEIAYFETVYGENKVITYDKIVAIQGGSIDDAKQKYNYKLDNYYAEFLCNNDMNKLNELKDKFSSYQKLRKYYNKDRAEMFNDPFKLVEWYDDQKQTCCYCGIKEEDLIEYFNEQNPQYFVSNEKGKKARQRGKVLEIERVVTAPKSENVYTLDNTKLACYICNNAKSDFLSAKDFEPIAFGIYNFWKTKVGDKIVFPGAFYKN